MTAFVGCGAGKLVCSGDEPADLAILHGNLVYGCKRLLKVYQRHGLGTSNATAIVDNCLNRFLCSARPVEKGGGGIGDEVPGPA
jgi:hypothetical protein